MATKKKSPVQAAEPVVDAELFQIVIRVDVLVTVDGKPSRVVSTEPKIVMAAEWGGFKLDAAQARKAVLDQVTGQNGQKPVG